MKDGRAVRRWLVSLDSKTDAQIDYAAWRLLLIGVGPVKARQAKGDCLGNMASFQYQIMLVSMSGSASSWEVWA